MVLTTCWAIGGEAQVYPSSVVSPFAGPETLQTPKMDLQFVGNQPYPQLNAWASPYTTAACPLVEQIDMYNISCDVYSFIKVGCQMANSTNATVAATGYQLLDVVFDFLDQGFATGPGNDVWGFDDPRFGNAYALIGAANGLSVIDVTVPQSPQIVGFFPGPYSIWRDIKTRDNFAYYVQDDFGYICNRIYTGVNRSYCAKLTPTDGLSIVDLSRGDSPVLVKHDTSFFTYAHNLFIEVDSHRPYAYVCGGNVNSIGGVVILNISDPINPHLLFSFDGAYLHDVVVQQRQSDGKYLLYGSAIFADAGTDQLYIWDVTDPTQPQQMGSPGKSKYPLLHNGISASTTTPFFLFLTSLTLFLCVFGDSV